MIWVYNKSLGFLVLATQFWLLNSLTLHQKKLKTLTYKAAEHQPSKLPEGEKAEPAGAVSFGPRHSFQPPWVEDLGFRGLGFRD